MAQEKKYIVIMNTLDTLESLLSTWSKQNCIFYPLILLLCREAWPYFILLSYLDLSSALVAALQGRHKKIINYKIFLEWAVCFNSCKTLNRHCLKLFYVVHNIFFSLFVQPHKSRF